MKKMLCTVCAVLLGASAFTGCKKQEAAGDLSLQKVLAAKTLTLGLDDSFPPMGFRDENGEITGYDIDLAKEAARRLGVALVTQPIDWNAKEQELNTGEIDCIWNGFTITEERKKALLFTPPYLRNAQVAVVKTASPVVSLADLAGKSVGTQAGSSSLHAIDGAPEFKASLKQIVEYRDYLTALMDLDVGGLDAVVIDLLVANDNINRSGKQFRVLDETLEAEEYGIGFRLNDKALADAVWQTLLEMAADGTIAGISEKWFGADINIAGE
ncbi:MAG: amino acid ABC transporter substrate-binding protein [Spirochaetaceae bacterium]|jgi:polar amino acid transport system substrate-binding protein|nr:amino acid ABC transporter substrate-binding protein [Spirochaetaceae bacterium]